MRSPYLMPEYAAFCRAIRADRTDRLTPLVAADWLEDHGKADHGRFIRGCVRMAELRDVIDDCLKADLHYTDPTRAVPRSELFDLVNDLRPMIQRHAHEWTAGAVRSFVNPTAYDWPMGFLLCWQVAPLKPGSDRESDEGVLKGLAAILARQPISLVQVLLPDMTFLPPVKIIEWLAERFRGIVFTHGTLSVMRGTGVAI